MRVRLNPRIFNNQNYAGIVLLISIFVLSLTSYKVSFLRYIFNCEYLEPIDVVYTWVNGSDPEFRRLREIYLMKEEGLLEEGSDQRFDDKDELKYSLRSLEKYAPWINHVYIVTNGQIPSWLNIEYSKVSIVTHEEIFVDKRHLPTFSSAAIETHLHRIKGLSEKFIYFNDDIFLNAPVYPEDFYSVKDGYVLYLAYFMPRCSEKCPWEYLGDGVCHKDCDIKECNNDFGDCRKYSVNFANLKENQLYKREEFEYTREEKEARRAMLARVDSDTLEYHKVIADIEKRRQEFFASINRTTTTTTRRTKTNRTRTFIQRQETRPPTAMQMAKLTDSVLIRRLAKIFMNVSNSVERHNNEQFQLNEPIHYRSRRIFNADELLKDVEDAVRNSSHIDAYAGALYTTNRLLTQRFGYRERKIAAHTPIMINRNIMKEVESKFWTDFKLTSSHRFRSHKDIQYSFLYYYNVIEEKVTETLDELFYKFDTDKSGYWSMREIKFILPYIYPLPVEGDESYNFNLLVHDCIEQLNRYAEPLTYYLRYSHLPVLPRAVVHECKDMKDLLKEAAKANQFNKYKYTVREDFEKYLSFHMLTSFIEDAEERFDEVRDFKDKFVCLNDNLDSDQAVVNAHIRILLNELYVTLFPTPSSFELKHGAVHGYISKNDYIYRTLFFYKYFLLLTACFVTLSFLVCYPLIRYKFTQCIKYLFYSRVD